MGWYRAIKRFFLIEGGRARIISGLNLFVRQSLPIAAVQVVTCRSHDRSYSNRDVETVGQPARPPHEEQWKSTSIYFLVCLGTVLGCYALFLSGLLLLRANDNLPPPIVTNNLCFDEKIHWMSYELPSTAPDLLVFGSSVAWRHFDGGQAIESGLAKNPYNLGFCGMRLSQTAFVARYFLTKRKFQFPVRAVIIASPQDFEGCSSSEEQVFSKPDADQAIFSRTHGWELYLKNVDPVPFVRNASVVKAQRSGPNDLNRGLIFTRYGDGPIDTAQTRDLTYGPITNLKQECFVALKDLAQYFSSHEIETILVLTPINPQWLSKFDPDRRILNEVRSGVSEALKKSDVRVWDASENKSFSELDFFDAVHLRWSSVRRFMTAMVGFAINGT
jgi:hypothetical protein